MLSGITSSLRKDAGEEAVAADNPSADKPGVETNNRQDETTPTAAFREANDQSCFPDSAKPPQDVVENHNDEMIFPSSHTALSSAPGNVGTDASPITPSVCKLKLLTAVPVRLFLISYAVLPLKLICMKSNHWTTRFQP